MSIRLIVIEPLEIVRLGLRALFHQPDFVSWEFEIVAEAAMPDKMLSLCSSFQPDIIMTEIQFPGMSALDEIQSLKQTLAKVKVLVYTASDNPAFLARSAVIGVDEYVEKSTPTADLLAALVNLHGGKERPIGHKLNRITKQMTSKRIPIGQEVPLTGRELQVLRHIAFGMSNKEIARSLTISIDTVKEHVQNILRKTGLRDRTHAAVWAVRNKII